MRHLAVLGFALFACSESISPEVDAGPPDAPPLVCEDELTACSENCVDTQSDPMHCGACNQACSEGADSCTFGACLCGLSAECPFPSECIDELCNDPDQNGQPCEFDEECQSQEYCVTGFCTVPSCKHEKCNGADDDCNGLPDDIYACVLGATQSCVTSCNTVGTMTCGSGGIEGECSWGECVPPAESCNTQDDDCDGLVDEDFDCIPGDLVDCGNVCGEGITTCATNCTWGPCVGSPNVDICDGVDNDCDWQVDEDELASYCYTGPSGTEFYPPCQLGVRLCLNGQSDEECLFEITPKAEAGILLCDGVDNDCDGCVDGVIQDGTCLPYDPIFFDIVFVIDVSGSMGGYNQAVIMATDQLAGQFAGNNNILFALVEFGDGSPWNGEGEVLTDLVEFTSFQTVLQNDLGPISGGVEPSYDVITELTNGTLPISWRSGANRIIILFADEPAQTNYGYTETSMCTSMQNGEILAVVTTMSLYGSNVCLDYDECVPASLCSELSTDPLTMLNDLNDIFTAGCAQ